MAQAIGPGERAAGTGGPRRPSFGSGVLLLAVLLTLSGCTMTQSEFAQTAGPVGSAFAAAATTLAYAHHKKITPAYAAASFVSFQDEVQGVAEQLPSLEGAPSARAVRQLLALYEPAERAVMHPCLDPSCDWRAQVRALQRAGDAFVKAAGG
jgi:chitinase